MSATATAMVKGLDSDTIKSLMAGSRTRNAYGPKLLEFVNSDEAGINPKDAWPIEFGDKNPATLYQGFNLAITKADLKNEVRVLRRDEDIFLLHNERMRVMLETAPQSE